MKLLSIILSGNARSLAMQSAQYEDVFNAPAKEKKRLIKIKAPVNDIMEPVKNEVQEGKAKRPRINYFAGPHCVFDPRML